MPQPTGSSDDDRVLERFKPTTGLVVGWAGMAVAVFAIGYVVVAVHTVVGLRIGLGALFGAVVIWVSQLRPRANAHTRHLELKGPLRDALVPYLLIDSVTMAQTLNVWVGDRRFVCIGIGQSLGSDIKQRAKREREGSLLGASRSRTFSEKAEKAAPDQTAMSYQTFVVTRIEELVDQAKRDHRRRGGADDERGEISRPFAVPELVALGVLALAFLVSLFL